jgi:hypothetical protein
MFYISIAKENQTYTHEVFIVLTKCLITVNLLIVAL